MTFPTHSGSCGACAYFEYPLEAMPAGRCLWAMRVARPDWAGRPAWFHMPRTGGLNCPTFAARPRRLRLSRVAGFRLHQQSFALNDLPARRVDRASAFGNPFRFTAVAPLGTTTCDEETAPADHAAALVALFRDWLANDPAGRAIAARARAELAGHNLACWCALGKPCHADVLLEIANG